MRQAITTTYTLEQAIQDAVERATRDREGCFAVILDGEDIIVQDARAARPSGSRLECVAQFWSAQEDGTMMVQIRRSDARSEFRGVV